MKPKVDVVVVTFNRLNKLKTALKCYESQTEPFRNLILVNNCSTDGTSEYINEWEKTITPFNKVIINSDENLGGSGGFYLGQCKAVELDADWVYVADDDAYPSQTMVEKFYDFINSNNTDNISAICAAVYDTNGAICVEHRDRWTLNQGKYYHRYHVPEEEYSKDSFPIDLLSYVGSFLKVSAIKTVGLVNPEFFIFYDDSEHSFRLKKAGEILCVPKIVVEHDFTVGKTAYWKYYYLIRNLRYMLMKHMPVRVVARSLASFFLKGAKNVSSDQEYKRLYVKATWDAILGKMGKNKIYHP